VRSEESIQKATETSRNSLTRLLSGGGFVANPPINEDFYNDDNHDDDTDSSDLEDDFGKRIEAGLLTDDESYEEPPNKKSKTKETNPASADGLLNCGRISRRTQVPKCEITKGMEGFVACCSHMSPAITPKSHFDVISPTWMTHFTDWTLCADDPTAASFGEALFTFSYTSAGAKFFVSRNSAIDAIGGPLVQLRSK
jgi:hypothetical protein